MLKRLSKFSTASIVLAVLIVPCIWLIHSAVADNQAIDVWWPTESATVSGIQPFKALLTGADLSSYTMFWSVDNGQLNAMSDTQTDYPHKEATVDLTNWNWRADGSYVITFIAQNQQGAEIARRSVTIHLPASAPVVTPQPTVATSTLPSATSTIPVSATTTIAAANPIATLTPPPVSAKKDQPTAPVSVQLYVNTTSDAKQQAENWRSSRPFDAAVMDKVAAQPTAFWFGDWNSSVTNDVQNVVKAASANNTVPVLVAYDIPHRDCGAYSAGGADAATTYKMWIDAFAQGIGSRNAIVILEPDALAGITCLSKDGQNERYSLLSYAVKSLKSKANTVVYLDAGNSSWVPADEMADRLNQAGVANANGFSLNVSNFYPTDQNAAYGQTISQKIGGKHFVIDTSRNGSGSNGEWCNPGGRSLGNKPTLSTGNPLIDAYLWVKRPGESDGNCNGGPNAGTWWPDYVLDLAKRAGY